MGKGRGMQTAVRVRRAERPSEWWRTGSNSGGGLEWKGRSFQRHARAAPMLNYQLGSCKHSSGRFGAFGAIMDGGSPLLWMAGAVCSPSFSGV